MWYAAMFHHSPDLCKIVSGSVNKSTRAPPTGSGAAVCTNISLLYDPRNRPSQTVPVKVNECSQLMLSGEPSRAAPEGVIVNSHTPAAVEKVCAR